MVTSTPDCQAKSRFLLLLFNVAFSTKLKPFQKRKLFQAVCNVLQLMTVYSIYSAAPAAWDQRPYKSFLSQAVDWMQVIIKFITLKSSLIIATSETNLTETFQMIPV